MGLSGGATSSPPTYWRLASSWFLLCLLTGQVTALILTNAQRQELLDAHNTMRRWRNATDMRLMRWDCSLERWAANHLKTCRKSIKHSKGRSLGQAPVLTGFDYIGESVDWLPSNSVNQPMVNLTDVVASHWHDWEINKFTFSTTSCDPPGSCWHYTQTVWADTYALGCAITRCFDQSFYVNNEPIKSQIHVSCNYGRYGNWFANKPPECPYMPKEDVERQCIFSGQTPGSEIPWAGSAPCAGCLDQIKGGNWPEQKAIQWSKHCIDGLCSDTAAPPPLPTCTDIPDTEADLQPETEEPTLATTAAPVEESAATTSTASRLVVWCLAVAVTELM